ncbi:hypothetical protein SISNIDRAFT_468915 [Sistotremastrum niveocremeum HHB9708]|uniref:Uncharacterized protein n=1 Tax=Sistotremastrum niveocremeum HHB9708 TaxID=1314777 RepID=A0A164QTH8_9AGAM|nr:hypothetical protein SISNIDRAFT_468915 [Sistotremastrum niveocremeum HHB9708]
MSQELLIARARAAAISQTISSTAPDGSMLFSPPHAGPSSLEIRATPTPTIRLASSDPMSRKAPTNLPFITLARAFVEAKEGTSSFFRRLTMFTKTELGLPPKDASKARKTAKKRFKLNKLWHARLAPGSSANINLKALTKYNGSIYAREQPQSRSNSFVTKLHPLASGRYATRIEEASEVGFPLPVCFSANLNTKRELLDITTMIQMKVSRGEFLESDYGRPPTRPASEVTSLFEDPDFLRMFEEFLGEPISAIGTPVQPMSFDDTVEFPRESLGAIQRSILSQL